MTKSERAISISRCRIVLGITNGVLMIMLVSVVLYFVWTITSVRTEGEAVVVGAGLSSQRAGKRVLPLSSPLRSDYDDVDENLSVNDVDTNKVKLSPSSLNTKARSPKQHRNQASSQSERRKSLVKSTFNTSKRRNIYGFKKRKSTAVISVQPKLNIGDDATKHNLITKANKYTGLEHSKIDRTWSEGPIYHTKNKASRSPWGPWAPCSVECGLGQQERVRSCGVHCQEVESKPCLDKPCAGSKMADRWAYYEMFDLTETDVTIKSGDPCEKWMQCSNKSIQHYLSNIAKLPNCPCHYPVIANTDISIYDDGQERHFLWEDASGDVERNDVYKPGARYCIRSRLPRQSVTLAAQHCCYDSGLKLITRGRDAGTPNLVSPQLSRDLHRKVDILPWVMCKGDWTRYNRVVQPNNHKQCVENPCLGEISQQIHLLKSY